MKGPACLSEERGERWWAPIPHSSVVKLLLGTPGMRFPIAASFLTAGRRRGEHKDGPLESERVSGETGASASRLLQHVQVGLRQWMLDQAWRRFNRELKTDAAGCLGFLSHVFLLINNAWQIGAALASEATDSKLCSPKKFLTPNSSP
ncbi:hypothetical protein AOLI_G00325600 [Acnodon oligacanthus]